jgi:hypothetical protein
MRFIMIVKASPESEAGAMPPAELFTAMTKYKEELVNAGMMLAGEGLHPSAKGARITFDGGKPTVKNGPFPEPDQLMAGYWIIQAKSMQEAIDWGKRAPFPEGELEIRQIFETEEFGDALPADVKEREERLRERVDRQKVS